MVLRIDLETFSSVDLKKFGMHKYVSSPDFRILLMAYAVDDHIVNIIDIEHGETIPVHVLAMLDDPTVTKRAWNAAFEFNCLGMTDLSGWECSAAHAAYLGLPRSLDKCGEVLNMGIQKDPVGKRLITKFCKPGKKPVTYAGPDWELFKGYCIKDVEVERAIDMKLEKFPMPEWDLWRLDQEINNRGALVDMAFVDAAMKVDATHRADLIEEAYILTGLDNPNSRNQLKAWLEVELDEEIPTLNKVAIKELNERVPNRVLEIRSELSRSSISKYAALKGATCPDGRIKGTLLFCGAARTHRWAGRIWQPQNLPQNHLKDLALAREVVMEGNYHDVQFLFGSVSDTLSQLIRTCLVPGPGKKFIVSDFSAIEARVAAWLAGEEWVLEVFRTHGKIYEATASSMFKVPLEGVTKELRQRGKVAVLALGYGGGVGALSAMDINGLIPDEEKQPLVNAWRAANPNIVAYWWKLDAAAKLAVQYPRTRQTVGKAAFIVENDLLFMELPSGNRLCYPRPRIMTEPKYGKEQVTYEGVDQKHPQWGRIFTYGPKFAENLAQSVARDILADAMLRMPAIVLHVHDEVVLETHPSALVEAAELIMSITPAWAKGLPLKAAGFETQFYMKD